MPYKNIEDKRKADKRYREKNKEKISKKGKEYYQKNKENILKQQKEYSDENREKVRSTNRKSYNKHKDKTIKKQLEYYHKNKKEISKKRKIYRGKNKDKINKINKIYMSKPESKEKRRNYERSKKYRIGVNKRIRKRKKIDKSFAIQTRLRRLVHLALQRELRGGKNGTSKRYGINYKKIIEHLKPFPKDLSKYEIDHIHPVVSFQFINKDGSTNFEEIKKAFAPENHQWLTIHENRKKSGKIL